MRACVRCTAGIGISKESWLWFEAQRGHVVAGMGCTVGRVVEFAPKGPSHAFFASRRAYSGAYSFKPVLVGWKSGRGSRTMFWATKKGGGAFPISYHRLQAQTGHHLHCLLRPLLTRPSPMGTVCIHCTLSSSLLHNNYFAEEGRVLIRHMIQRND